MFYFVSDTSISFLSTTALSLFFLATLVLLVHAAATMAPTPKAMAIKNTSLNACTYDSFTANVVIDWIEGFIPGTLAYAAAVFVRAAASKAFADRLCSAAIFAVRSVIWAENLLAMTAE
jgi:hypothetical protein